MSAVYGSGVPDVLAPHLVICSTQSPLVSFECIEWHPADRVRRQFGMQQLPPGPAFDLGRDHCKRLTGAHNHDWGQIYSEWVNRWSSDRYNTLQVPSEEFGADEPQQQQEEPPSPQPQAPPHEQQFQYQMPAYAQQFQDPAYVQQFPNPAYAQQWPAYQQQAPYIPEPQPTQAPYIPEPQPTPAPEPYIPLLVIPVEGYFSPLGGSDSISFSQVLRDSEYLFLTAPQEGSATSQQFAGHRATLGHASDFDCDQSTGHVDLPGPSAPPCSQLFDLNIRSKKRGIWDTTCSTDFSASSELDAGVSQGHPYNLRTQTAPPNKYTPSLYSKKAPRK
ncbi:uncharacterized protein DS421_6g174620 [Arachis hypogaea]|nr:uncharacterized protein DS421_6g174620 [Arachis hypogaea]